MADPDPSAPAVGPAGTLRPEAAWYDRHYEVLQPDMPPWYAHLLPVLRRRLQPGMRLLECGCGQGHGLRYLAAEGLLPAGQIYGVDQSRTAIEFVRARLPGATFEVMDLAGLRFGDGMFDMVLLMETIEHLEDPGPALAEMGRVLKPGGWLFLSFPNYLHLPWWVVRVLAEKLNRPGWIVLQPIDRVYTVLGVIRRVRRAGLVFAGGTGSIYGPPVLYRYEPGWLTTALNRLGLYALSFHPILSFRKPEPTSGEAPSNPVESRGL